MTRKVAIATITCFFVGILSVAIFAQAVNAGDLSDFSSTADSVRIQASVLNGASPSWSFDSARNWASFAYVSNDSVQLVIGLNHGPENLNASLSPILVQFGGRFLRQVTSEGFTWAVVASLPLDKVSAFALEARSSNLIKYVEPNFRFHADFTPNDPYFGYQYGLTKIQAAKAWDIQRGDQAVLVAVVDTGIDWHHPDLMANYVPLGYDWVNHDNNPMDDNGHGTHVAGIIAATMNNSIGIAGIAQVRIMAEKALNYSGDGLEDELANAIIHAVDQGARIISMSWGDYNNSTLIFDAVEYAYKAGVLLVAAAGNDGVSTEMFPAAYDQVVAVTATDSNDNPASFTNFGRWVELAAPGVGIWSTYWSAYSGSTYAPLTGTSMAAPFVSGVAALVWSQFPNLSRDQVRIQLRNSADDLGSPGFDYYYGYGRINAWKALHMHDLAVNHIGVSKTVIGQGYSDSVNVTLVNRGDFAEAANMTLYTQLQRSLVGYWKFDDGIGAVVNDSSGNNDDVTAYGAAWVDGRFGEGLGFDGVDDFAETNVSRSLNFSGNQFTISAWVFPRVQRASSGDVIARRLGSRAQYFVGWWWNGSEVGFGTGLYNGVGVGFGPSVYHPVDVWYHVVSVYNGTTLRLYVNDELELDRAVSGNLLPVNAPLYFARESVGSEDVYFNGTIDDVKIFDVGLSEVRMRAEELSAHVQSVTVGAGVSESVVFSWDTSDFVKGNYTLSAYVTPVLGEIVVSDNGLVFGSVCVAMRGDVGGVGVFPGTLPDGVVDLTDLSLISRVYGVYSWDVRFVPNYDVNGDGRIDIKDLAIAAKSFGKVDP